jgi:hypothetical protein
VEVGKNNEGGAKMKEKTKKEKETKETKKEKETKETKKEKETKKVMKQGCWDDPADMKTCGCEVCQYNLALLEEE